MSYMNKVSKLDEMFNEVRRDDPHGTPVLGKDIPDVKLQRLEKRAWVDYRNDDKKVKSPVDLNKLPPGNYRLV